MSEVQSAFEIIVNDIKEQEAIIDNQIRNEVEFSHEDQINIFKAGLKKEIDTFFEKELNELRVFSATESSQAKLKIKRELLMKRQELVEKLFSAVKEELKNFCKSEDYHKYLIKKLNLINTLSEDAYFLVKNDDIELMKKILKSKNLMNKIQVTDIIGGFKIIDNIKNIEYDFTLDTCLKEQKKWFQNNSGLSF